MLNNPSALLTKTEIEMNKCFCLLLTLLFCSASYAAGESKLSDAEDIPQVAPVSLTDLASRADLVAVAQVKDTDYVYARTFPNEGSAFLKILIEYKLNNPAEEIIEVYDKGLHPGECYFENPTVLEEGRRYLVFLRLDPDDPEIYRGLTEGCALELFVTQDNRYALKYPIDGLKLTDNLAELVSQFDYRDNYAVVEEDSITPVKRDELLADGLIIPYQGKFKYTQGIDLTSARNLISAEALKPRRSWEQKQ
jgi:hypothetical protein